MRIGLEIHVALPTKSKLFCLCSTHANEPNTAICPICTGMPGSKPTLNKSALEFAVSIAKALACRIPELTSFVRKVYFYPDLPKSFQITQKDEPIGINGKVHLGTSEEVRIRRLQLEEDPAKIIRQDDYTLIDFNRSGMPLVEIVTEPDIVSENELREFMIELKSILYYLGIDIDRELKVDLNISLSSSRVEVKNVTGMKNLLDAAKYEIHRQDGLIKSNQEISQETRSYDEKNMQTISSREKESDEEYGFIFEPDLTVYDISKIKPAPAVYASKIAKEYAKKYGVKEVTLREMILFNNESLQLIESNKDKYEMKHIINTIELLLRYSTKKPINPIFEKTIALVKKDIYPDKDAILKIESGENVEIYAASNTKDIDEEIKRLMKENSKLFKEYKKNPKVFNFIIGAVIKKFKANPKIVSERLEKILTDAQK